MYFWVQFHWNLSRKLFIFYQNKNKIKKKKNNDGVTKKQWSWNIITGVSSPDRFTWGSRWLKEHIAWRYSSCAAPWNENVFVAQAQPLCYFPQTPGQLRVSQWSLHYASFLRNGYAWTLSGSRTRCGCLIWSTLFCELCFVCLFYQASRGSKTGLFFFLFFGISV